MSRYETKTISDLITLDETDLLLDDVIGNGCQKIYFPNDYEYYFEIMGINHLEKTEWNKVMENIGDELVEDMKKVFIKHFRKEYWKEHYDMKNKWNGDTTYSPNPNGEEVE